MKRRRRTPYKGQAPRRMPATAAREPVPLTDAERQAMLEALEEQERLHRRPPPPPSRTA